MKTKEQIELAEKIISYLEDYVVLAKAQKKLKVESVDEKIDRLTELVKDNSEKL